MKRYLIDANALISFVTDRNPEQQGKVAKLFESAQHLKAVILCHQHILTEFIEGDLCRSSSRPHPCNICKHTPCFL